MKRKTLTTAVLAGLTGVAGMVSVANAVNVNPDGLGQVLIYPYYTARGGNDTLISVVNTSSQAKAAKVRFLEGLNSREVLDFNLYLSAFDIWTAAITEDGDGAKLITTDSSCTVPYIFGSGGGGPDTAGEQEFLTFEFTGDKEDGATTGAERVASGYLEIIDMGTVVGDTPITSAGQIIGWRDLDVNPDGEPLVGSVGTEWAVTHIPVFDEDGNEVLDESGTQIRRPRDCSQLVDAWSDVSIGEPPAEFYWTNSDGEVDVNPSTGGDLFGSASIIDVEQGTMFSYNATAIDNFTVLRLHNRPGNVAPSLLDGGQLTSNVFESSGGAGVRSTEWDETIQAVNAVLMNNRILNEYNIESGINAQTEWVLNFPTKRFHVDAEGGFAGEQQVVDDDGPVFDDDNQPVLESVAVPPFSKLFDGESCEPIGFNFWDREERAVSEDQEVIRPIVSPEPPPDEIEITVFEACFEANVVRFANAGDAVPDASEILGEPRFTTFPLPDDFSNGWLRLGFDLELLADQLNESNIADLKEDLGLLPDAREQTGTDVGTEGSSTYFGLPVIGFGVTTFANGTIEVDNQAVLSNYGGTFDHRGTRRIE